MIFGGMSFPAAKQDSSDPAETTWAAITDLQSPPVKPSAFFAFCSSMVSTEEEPATRRRGPDGPFILG